MSELINARDVAYSYGAQSVLQAVSFSVRPSEFVALVGSNGSGKSTLLRCLLGLATPTKGTVDLFGQPAASVGKRWRIGYVPQRPILHTDVPVTVREIVETGRLSRRGVFRSLGSDDKRAIDEAIDDVGLSAFSAVPMSQLSGGQQQRAFVARALASEPEILILDEPVAGVDAQSQQGFRDVLVHMVKEHQTAVLLVSHELGAVAEDLDRILVLQSGVIAFDGPPQGLRERGVSLGVHTEDLPMWLESGDAK